MVSAVISPFPPLPCNHSPMIPKLSDFNEYDLHRDRRKGRHFFAEAPLIPLATLIYDRGVNYSLVGCESLNARLSSHPFFISHWAESWDALGFLPLHPITIITLIVLVHYIRCPPASFLYSLVRRSSHQSYPSVKRPRPTLYSDGSVLHPLDAFLPIPNYNFRFQLNFIS